MASGYVHAKVTLYTAPAAFAIGLVSSGVLGGVVAATGCVLGILLTPDLDQQTYSMIENRLRKSKNPVVSAIGWAYIGFFYAYAKAIPHRSPVSHAPLIGTAFRLIYIVCMVSLALSLVTILTPWSPVYVFITFLAYALSSNPFWMAIIGLTMSDFMHWVFDRPELRRLAHKMDSDTNKYFQERRK